jgi:hypothetical protein
VGLLDKADHSARVVHPHDPQSLGFMAMDRFGSDSYVGPTAAVGGEHLGIVHPVKLIPREDEHVIDGVASEIADVLTDGVGRPLVPIPPFVAGERLLGGEDFDKPATEGIEAIGAPDVTMKAHRQELSEHIAAIDTAVDAVGNGDVDQPVFPAQGDGRLRAVLGKGLQASPASTPQDNGHHVIHNPAPRFGRDWGCQLTNTT